MLFIYCFLRFASFRLILKVTQRPPLKGGWSGVKRGEYIGILLQFSFFLHFCATATLSTCVEDPLCTECNKQPSATFWKRISLYILYKTYVAITLRFCCAPKWEPGRAIFILFRLLCNNVCFNLSLSLYIYIYVED